MTIHQLYIQCKILSAILQTRKQLRLNKGV